MRTLFVHSALACFASISFIVLLRNTARRMGLVDYPGGRKQHEGGVPVVGGIAIYGAFAFSALLVTQAEPLYPFRPLLGGMGLLVFAGVLDDMHDLSALAKLVMQCIAALLMVSWGGLYVPELGNILGFGVAGALGNFAIPFTFVAVLGLINAMNMTDGVDGLAGSLALVSLTALAGLYLKLDLDSHLLMISIIIGALIGFLCFNLRNPLRRRAGVFLGDAGSMALGFAICWFAVSIAKVPKAPVPPIAVVWIVAIPLLDMGVVILRRLLSGRSPLSADREHLHHLLLQRGFSDAATTLTLTGAAVAAALVGLAIWKYRIPDAFGFYGFIALLAITVAATRRLPRVTARTSGDIADAKRAEPTYAGTVLPLDSDARETRKR